MDSANLKTPVILPGEFDPAGEIIRANLLASVTTRTVPTIRQSMTVEVTFSARVDNPPDDDRLSRLAKLYRLYKSLRALRAARLELEVSNILNAIRELSQEENDDDYISKPSEYAIENAQTAITGLYELGNYEICSKLPQPRVFSDGTGGIVCQWSNQGRTINAGFPPDDRRPNYIYYESGDTYKLIDLTSLAIKERLTWLTHE